MAITHEALAYEPHMLPRMFESMLRKMPAAYRGNPRGMKLYVSPAIAAGYREALARRMNIPVWPDISMITYAGIPIIADEGHRDITTLTERASLVSYDTRSLLQRNSGPVPDARTFISRLRSDIRIHYQDAA